MKGASRTLSLIYHGEFWGKFWDKTLTAFFNYREKAPPLDIWRVVDTPLTAAILSNKNMFKIY